jgi:hypothetical protein
MFGVWSLEFGADWSREQQRAKKCRNDGICVTGVVFVGLTVSNFPHKQKTSQQQHQQQQIINVIIFCSENCESYLATSVCQVINDVVKISVCHYQ